MRLLGGDDCRKAALLERQHVNSIRLRINTCRVANDVDEPVKRMQPPEEIIVFPIGARQERGEMAEADALQALDAVNRKSTRLNSSHEWISYAVFCLKKKRTTRE